MNEVKINLADWISVRKKKPPLFAAVHLYGRGKFDPWPQSVTGYWDGKKFRLSALGSSHVIRTTVTHWLPMNL